MRRPAGWNEENAIETKPALGGACYGDVAGVNGVEGAAKKRDAPGSGGVRVAPDGRLRFQDFSAPEALFASGPGDGGTLAFASPVEAASLFSADSGGVSRSSASAMPRTSWAMPSPVAEERA